MKCKIDDETIEQYALGKLTDPRLEVHILTCVNCQAKIADARNWDAFLVRARQYDG